MALISGTIGATALAGKLLPFLAKAGSAAKLPMVLRTAGILGGAAPGLMRGDLGSAVTGGALGAVGTLGMGGAAKGLSGAAAKKIFAEGTKRGLSNQAIAQLQGVAQAGIPIAGVYLSKKFLANSLFPSSKALPYSNCKPSRRCCTSGD